MLLRLSVVAIVLGLMFESCHIDVPKPTSCGAFDYSVGPNKYLDPGVQPYPGPGRVTLSFSFKPEKCEATPCRCNKVVFVQAIRFLLPPRIPKQPHDDQTERMTHSQTPFFDGWAIDTVENAIQPYYGMSNDGSFPFSPTNPDQYSASPGSNFSSAVLRDSPGSRDWDSYTIEVISVPVCLDSGSPCDHRTLGYYQWGWGVPDKNQPNNFVRDFHDEAITDLYVQAFDLAVQAWNDHLDNKRQFLQLSRLP